MNTNYYHRTHKNYNYGSRGKVDHFDCPTNLFSLNNTDKSISWVYSVDVKEDSLIDFHQVVFAISRLINIYSNKKIKEWLDKDKKFNSLLQKDNIGRKFIIYKEYKKWILSKKSIKLTQRQRKELKLWILGL